jgi:hypothetical protein
LPIDPFRTQPSPVTSLHFMVIGDPDIHA